MIAEGVVAAGSVVVATIIIKVNPGGYFQKVESFFENRGLNDPPPQPTPRPQTASGGQRGGPPTTVRKPGCATNNGPPFENRYPEDLPEYTKRIAAETALSRSDTYIYVVQGGILKIGKATAGHIDLADGQPVEAAGEFTTKGGKVVAFNNKSGHYCPSGPRAEAAARAAFGRYGMSINGPYTEVGG